RWQEKRNELSDEFVAGHSGQAAFQELSRLFIIRRDAGEIKIRRRVGLKFMEEFVSATQNVKAPGLRSIQAEATEIADPPRLAIHEPLAKGAMSHAYQAALFAGNDRLFCFLRQVS